MSSVDTPRDVPPGVAVATRWNLERVWTLLPHVVVLVFLVAFPLLASDYQTGLMTQFFTYGLLARSLDLLGHWRWPDQLRPRRLVRSRRVRVGTDIRTCTGSRRDVPRVSAGGISWRRVRCPSRQPALSRSPTRRRYLFRHHYPCRRRGSAASSSPVGVSSLVAPMVSTDLPHLRSRPGSN